MPRLDKTGPKGLGPKTGRGMGDCSNQSISEYSESMPDRGMSCQGRGKGRGQGGELRNGCRQVAEIVSQVNKKTNNIRKNIKRGLESKPL